ncbi:NACHT domain-containing protein [Embleya sp. NPDC127516]|uniref:NACHT domain-containing protein n=1 Tax=Embleya sp. NPDC127516 TaxID=3363990 RepID=UPI00381DF476
MRFDLTPLGSREFEHLTQALAMAELGPGVGVFGSGADGGREATFRGPVPVTTHGHLWSGYGVIQAKFMENPGKPKENAAWLASQINSEMAAWKERRDAGKDIPAYYLVSTNVRLSPQEQIGGIDKVDECMKSHAKTLGFKGWLVWHSDTISTLLATNNDVRTSYAAWITPGDVLASVLQARQEEDKEFPEALNSFLAKELLRQRYVNLDQSGSADDRNLALADIFVDLPFQPWQDEYAYPNSKKVLTTIISSSDARYGASGQGESDGQTESEQKYVLIGGPGQGKTTITQFICQVYRASLVAESRTSKQIDISRAIEKINRLMSSESIPVPRNRRWPINIQLTRLADDLAKNKSSSVLEYLANYISRRCTGSVSETQLKKWLRTYPWFVVLDGLDEVPAASNRAEVLSTIDDFLVEAASVNADLVVVATTRPQGYTDEFSPRSYRHLHLTALTEQVAMNFGSKLATARHGEESDRKDRLVERLERAYMEPATSRLMTTPLQVSILAVLLDRVGQAPKDRYTLFDEYYRVIYERELEKDSQASSLLRDHRSDVDAIHSRVGLLLQTQSERSGETTSTLSTQELRNVVRARLSREGHAGVELEALCGHIIQAATDRLVFLVSSRSDEIGFEIRSLQEFWAAQGVVQGTDLQVGNRLRAISASSHWRNTLLFALGSIFAKRENMRDTVVTLVSELNSHSAIHFEVRKSLLLGSRLAVSLLRDGMVRAPLYAQLLTEQALLLLRLPPDEDIRRLAGCIPKDTIEALVHMAEEKIAGRNEADYLSLITILVTISSRVDISELTRQTTYSLGSQLYAKIAPKDKDYLFTIAEEMHLSSLKTLCQDRLLEMPVHEVFQAVGVFRHTARRGGLQSRADVEGRSDWARDLVRLFRNSRTSLRTAVGSPQVESFGISIYIQTMTDSVSHWGLLLESKPPGQPWFYSVANFAARPSRESLAIALREASGNRESILRCCRVFPWVFGQIVVEEEDLSDAARKVEGGIYGDVADWESIEDSWGQMEPFWLSGSLSKRISNGDPFFPISAAQFSFTVPINGTLITEAIVASFQDYENRRPHSIQLRCEYASWLLTWLYVGSHASHLAHNLASEIGPARIMPVLRDIETRRKSGASWIQGLPVNEQWIDCLDYVGKNLGLPTTGDGSQTSKLIEAWLADTQRWGLARLAVCESYAHSEWSEEIINEWRKSPPVAGGVKPTQDTRHMISLMAAAFGSPKDRREAKKLYADVMACLAWNKDYAIEILDCFYPKESPMSRCFALMCADGLKDIAPRTRQIILRRLVEAQGADFSGMTGEAVQSGQLGEIPQQTSSR